MERTILLVDDEANILSALTRLLRPQGYRILRAGSGKEGLELLAQNEVGVIVSDQRMPEMTGVEFLHQVRDRYPDTVRIVLSGYTELNSITDAINRGAIYKFLTKPWEDDLLRANIEEAFQRYEMKRENDRLKHDLEKRVEEKTRELTRSLKILQISQEVLESLPVAVIGIDNDGVIAIANSMAHSLLGCGGERPLLGEQAQEMIPSELMSCSRDAIVTLPDGARLHCWQSTMGRLSFSQGMVLAFAPQLKVEQDGQDA
ncbi:MAG: response regulator [Sulfurimicrobium sp.]|nr:response regulator [Sulfurimicrobium sp.]MDP3689293.1 response regulator [Sulfurimicrobium sp.]